MIAQGSVLAVGVETCRVGSHARVALETRYLVCGTVFKLGVT